MTINNLKMTNNNADPPAAYNALRADNGAILVINDSEIFNTKSTTVGPAINFRENAESLTISDSTIRNNSTANFAGAIYAYGANVTIEGSTFSNNTAGAGTQNGRNAGAIYFTAGTNLIIRDSTFNNNSGRTGGAIYVNTGTLTLSDSTFRENTSTGSGSAIHGEDNSVNLNISGSTFSGNTSGFRGGAINASTSTLDLTVTNSVFLNNTAVNGGGAIYGGGPTIIYRSYFSGNRATGTTAGNGIGGAIFNGTSLRLENSTFYNNRSVNGGGALASWDLLSNKVIDIRHVTLVDNEATGSGINGNSVSFHAESVVSMFNSIIKEKASAAGTDCVGVDNNTSTISDNSGCSSSTGFNVNPRLASRRGSTAQPPWQYYPLRHDSPAIDAADATACSALNEAVDQRGVSRPQGSFCDIGAYEGFIPPPPPDSGGGGGGGGDDEDAEAVDDPGTPCADCDELTAQGYRLKATHGFSSGVQFRRVGPIAIGDQSLLAPGFLDAVDVYGWAEQGVGVCFPMAGSPLFLDAAYSPRQVMSVSAYAQDGMTCADFDRPGTLVLLAGEPPSSVAERAVGAQSVSAQTLDNCMVTTLFILNFRQTPGGERLHFVDPWGAEIAGWLPQGVMLTALERTADWFKVDYHGNQGWISARFLRTHGNCG